MPDKKQYTTGISLAGATNFKSLEQALSINAKTGNAIRIFFITIRYINLLFHNKMQNYTFLRIIIQDMFKF